MINMVKIGKNVKHYRIREALTQRQLAHKANVTEATLSRVERDTIEPHMSTVRKLADALGVHPSKLVED
jgi:transcriptional regulator with XRE-family HTH domain